MMKKIFWIVFLLFVANGVCGQDSSCVYKKVDKFNDRVTFKMTYAPIQIDSKTVLTIEAGGGKYQKKSLFIFIRCEGIRLVTNESNMIILFTDGSKQTINNTGSYDLNGNFMFEYPDIGIGGGKKMIKELLDKKIKGIRFVGASLMHDIDVPSETAQLINSRLNCFYNTWKKDRKE